MHCDDDDVDALNSEKSSTVDSVNVVGSKSRQEQSAYFEWMLRAGSRTRESAQA